MEDAVICGLLSTYYRSVVYAPGGDNDDQAGAWFSEELTLPAEGHSCRIAFALERLIVAGHDGNEADGSSNALTLSVGNGDASMMRFLIEHGADVSTWPDPDEAPDARQGNNYLDDVDMNFWGRKPLQMTGIRCRCI